MAQPLQEPEELRDRRRHCRHYLHRRLSVQH